MKRYLLVEYNEYESDSDVMCIRYFDDLVDLYSYVCHELMYNDLDIEDFKSDPYSGVEERLEEHGSSFFIFDVERNVFSLVIGYIKDGDWDNFENFCHPKKSNIMNFKLFTEGIIDDFRKKHSDKYDYSKVNYINNRTNVEIICPIHGSFFQNPYSHKSGSSCPKCVNRNKSDNYSFIEMARRIHGDKYDYSKVNYLNNKSKVQIVCSKHGVFEQTPNVHLSKGSGCPKCVGKNKGNDDFIEAASKYHSNKYDYSNVSYKNAHGKVDIKCPEHGIFKMSYNSHVTKGYGCPFCSESSGESKVKAFLTNNNINFEYHKIFKDCKYVRNLVFDFYLPDKNLIIEYDGRHHFMPIWGGDYEFSIIKKRDQVKNKYCEDKNIDMIRIKYDENIYDKLKEII